MSIIVAISYPSHTFLYSPLHSWVPLLRSPSTTPPHRSPRGRQGSEQKEEPGKRKYLMGLSENIFYKKWARTRWCWVKYSLQELGGAEWKSLCKEQLGLSENNYYKVVLSENTHCRNLMGLSESHSARSSKDWVKITIAGTWMERRTVLIWRAGLHFSFRMSRQILPSLSMFGW